MIKNEVSATSSSARRILVVSNRGPFEHRQMEDGGFEAVPGQGGVATALRLAAEYRPTTWLASPMTAGDRALAAGAPGGDTVGSRSTSRFIASEDEAYKLFYEVFSNEILWFLQHELPWPAEQTAAGRIDAWEKGYLPVNQAFAEAVVRELDSTDYEAVMLHDYHFYVAPLFIRNTRPRAYLQQFIHIPWPEPLVWSRLEDGMVASICRSLLANDSLVFQTEVSQANFLATCEAYLPDVAIDFAACTVEDGPRTTRVLANPISVDPQELEEIELLPEFARYQDQLVPAESEQLIVRVDRLDPSKNVYAGFQAYRRLLHNHPELHGRVRFLAFLVPTRSEVPAYREYQRLTLALVDEINAEFGTDRWTPISVKFENNRVQALAGLSLADVILVNPLADGMNLVCKEGALVNQRNAVLVLSTQAGAYRELAAGALGIDPREAGATYAALHRALAMSAAERNLRAESLRTRLLSHDLRRWFAALLGEIEVALPSFASAMAA